MITRASSACQRGRALIPATLLLLCCAGAHSSRRGDRVIVSGYPEPIQQAYRVFAVRCSRCHSLARPLNAHITDPQHWVRYVTRMRRQPTSGITNENAGIILRFLLYYAQIQQQEADKTAPEKTPALSAPSLAPAPPDKDKNKETPVPSLSEPVSAPEGEPNGRTP